MAKTLTARLNATFSAELVNSGAIANAQFSPSLTALLASSLASGTGAGKADTLYVKQFTLAANADKSLDVYDMAEDGGAAQTDQLGISVALANVKVLIVQILGNGASPSVYTEADYLDIGGDGTTGAWNSPFSGQDTYSMRLYSGTTAAPGTFILTSQGAAGFAVADTTNHLLKFHAGAGNSGSVVFNVVIVGASA